MRTVGRGLRAVAAVLLLAGGPAVSSDTTVEICLDVLGVELFCTEEPAPAPTQPADEPVAQPSPTPEPTVGAPQPAPPAEAPAPPAAQPAPAVEAPAAASGSERAQSPLTEPLATLSPRESPAPVPAPTSSALAPPVPDLPLADAMPASADAPLAFGAFTLTAGGLLALVALLAVRARWITPPERGRHASEG